MFFVFQEDASKSANSPHERIDKVLQDIREQSVLQEVSLSELFSNQTLYKDKCKQAQELVKQVQVSFPLSFKSFIQITLSLSWDC